MPLDRTYTLVRSDRKTLALHIGANGELTVKAPKRFTLAQIERFLLEKQTWIDKKSLEMQKRNAAFQDVLSYQRALCFGERFDVVPSDKVKQPAVCGKLFLLPLRYDAAPAGRAACLRKWTSGNVTQYLNEKLPYFAGLLQVEYVSYRLTGAKGRWGSCTSEKKLAFNWRLGMLPPALIDYVIVHELSHIVELNHSARFWHIVDRYVPDRKRLQKQLQAYSCLNQMK